MYPRNAASPPRISVGAVIQISDGAVQTAGVSVVVRPEGGVETAGAGTLSYGATSGVVYYAPTQAETDYTAFVVVAYKTGCIPAEKAVITSARSTAGEVQVGGYAAGQAPPTLTQIEGSTVLAKDSTVAKDATVAKDSTVAKDATVAKEATVNTRASQTSVNALPTANQNRDAVMNAMPSGGWDNGSFGDRWIVSNNSNRTIGVTGSGSGHVQCDVHAMQTDVITAASVSAAAVTKIQTGLASQTSVNTLTTYVDTEVLAIKAKTDNLPAQPAAVGDIPTAASNATAVWGFTLAGIDTAGSAAKVLTDAGTGIATLLTRITSAVYNTLVDLAQMIVNDGTANAQWSATAMANIPVAGGSGARTVTITVRDPSAVAIQNATVRISRTGESFALQTNASGVAVFSLDDATWTVAITATGFSFSPVSLVVSANVTQTYSMTAAGGGVTPSEAPMTTGFWTVYGVNGTIQAGAQVSIQASSPPAGSTGIVMEDAVRTATADNNGVVQFSNLIKGATYIVYRTGSSRKFNVVVPASAGNTVALGSIVG